MSLPEIFLILPQKNNIDLPLILSLMFPVNGNDVNFSNQMFKFLLLSLKLSLLRCQPSLIFDIMHLYLTHIINGHRKGTLTKTFATEAHDGYDSEY